MAVGLGGDLIDMGAPAVRLTDPKSVIHPSIRKGEIPMARIIPAAAIVVAVIAFPLVGMAAPIITITPIVIEGEDVPGVGPITSGFGACENMAVNNSGTWLVESDTTNPNTAIDGVVLRGTGPNFGILYFQQGQSLTAPAGASISSFDSIMINNAGNSSFNLFLSGTGSTNNDSGVYFNDTLLIQESNIATAAGFSPNTPYIGWFETRINNLDQILMVASVDDPAIASSVDRALVRIDNPSGAFTQTVIAKEGDQMFPGRFVTDFSTGPHNNDMNDSGHIMFLVDVDGLTTDDSAVMVYDGVDFVTKAREGDPCPAVPGRTWGSLLDKPIDMNNQGDWVIRAQLDASSTTDDVLIIKNGTTVIAREGSSLPAIGGVFTFTAFGTGAVGIDDSGNVFWFGDWNDPDLTRDTGIFMNDQLIVQEGVTPVGGNFIKSISAVEDNFHISNNGRWLIFEGTLNDDRDGAFLVEIARADGDMNCDGQINGLDLGAFAIAATDPSMYEITYPQCNIARGDFTGDSNTNADDVGGMVQAVLLAN